MAAIFIRQGDDKEVFVDVLKGNTQIDLTDAIEIRASLCINDQEFKRYSLTPQAGYGVLLKDISLDYRVCLRIEREHSKNFEEGNMHVAIVVVFTDGNFADGDRTVEADPVVIGRVFPGVLKDELL